METIFTKIITKEIPATVVYEDDVVLAFLDIQPVNRGHTLVIPKKHSTDATETDSDTLAHIMKVAQRIALAQRSELNATGNNLIFNCGADGSQEVFHTHLHVIPRYTNDEVFTSPTHVEYAKDEANDVAKKLQTAL